MKNIEKILSSKEKINNYLSFKSDDSSEEEKIIFPFLNTEINNQSINENKRNHFKLKDNKTDNIIEYKVEKGIVINPNIFLSNNKICFGLKNKIRERNKNENNKDKSYESSIQTYKNNKNRVNISFSNKLSLNNSNLFVKKKNNIKNKNLHLYKHTNYKSRNLALKDNFKSPKTKNFFTNETLSSYCKVLFEKRMNKNNNKEESTLFISNQKSHLTFNLFLNEKNKQTGRNTPTISRQIINDYKYKNICDKHKPKSNKNTKRKKNYINSRKYQFKCNPYMVVNKFLDLPKKIKELNKNNINLLKKEANKYYGFNFSLIQNGKFSKKFRNPLFNFNLTKEDIEKSEKKAFINENIISGVKILREINDKENNTKNIIIPKKNINKKKLLSKFKSLIIKNSVYLKLISGSSNEIITNNIIKTDNENDDNDIKYYENKNKKTAELIQAIKNGDLGTVDDLIEKNIYSVTDTDIFQFTPLHWATNKNFYLIIPKLVAYGAQVNAQNFLGDTPLHTSIKNNYYECTVLLLIYLASPFIKNNIGKQPFDYSNDYQMRIIYKKITTLHYKNTFAKNKLVYENIQNEFIKFILDEFATQIKRDCLIIIKDIERDRKNKTELELKFKTNNININK